MPTNHRAGANMPFVQPEVADVVISFARYASRAPSQANESCLTSRDRVDIANVRERARLGGFDRLVVHERDEGDASDVGDFLTVYRDGEAWSRWGFARAGHNVRAWCCLTGVDVGDYRTLREAFGAVLFKEDEAAPEDEVVSNLIPFRMMCGTRMGSAA